MIVIINGRELDWPKKRLSYNEVVTFAHGPLPEDDLVTVTFFRAACNCKGTLTRGKTIGIRNGTVFTALKTNKA
jgi:hypothetical protein